jgi:hypothetical protein
MKTTRKEEEIECRKVCQAGKPTGLRDKGLKKAENTER